MANAYPMALLSRVLGQRKEFIRVNDLETYKRCRVQLHAQGVIIRDAVIGAQLKTKRQQVCHAGEFLVAEIDAKVGGFGIVPPELNGAIVSSHYFLFQIDHNQLEPEFLNYLIRTPSFRDQVSAQGSTNYAAIRPDDVLGYALPLPPLSEQRRIVARIEELAAKIEEAHGLRTSVGEDLHSLLFNAYYSLVEGASRMPLNEVAPLVRRAVHVDPSRSYPELGIRSFGKGTFHKPSLGGILVGSKRLFAIEPGDLLFNNVFAWEGALAVAKPDDRGRFGSHRFISCVPPPDLATPEFLCFHFLTPEGLDALGIASPGGAGRNRTLGLHALQGIEVPIPPIDAQKWFTGLLHKAEGLRRLQAQAQAQLEALLPSVLERAFRGEL